MGQRFVQLDSSYTGSSDGSGTLHVSQLPPNPAILTPGPACTSIMSLLSWLCILANKDMQISLLSLMACQVSAFRSCVDLAGSRLRTHLMWLHYPRPVCPLRLAGPTAPRFQPQTVIKTAKTPWLSIPFRPPLHCLLL